MTRINLTGFKGNHYLDNVRLPNKPERPWRYQLSVLSKLLPWFPPSPPGKHLCSHIQVKFRLILVLPASTLAGRGNCRCQDADKSYIDVTVFCCKEQIKHVSAWIFLTGDKVHPSFTCQVSNWSRKMNSVGVHSIGSMEISSAIAVGCMGLVLGAGSVLKIKLPDRHVVISMTWAWYMYSVDTVTGIACTLWVKRPGEIEVKDSETMWRNVEHQETPNIT